MVNTPSKAKASFTFHEEYQSYYCEGEWTILTVDGVLSSFQRSVLPREKEIKIDGHAVKNFDSAGAITLWHCITLLKKHDNSITLCNFSKKQQDLLNLVEEKKDYLEYSPPKKNDESILYQLGKETVNKLEQANGLVVLVGDLSEKLLNALTHVRRFHGPSIIATIHATGVTALPIIGLLSFLIGVVLAYQMGLQLETYGANVFIAYLSGMAIFREFSPLITAIIVAGRTSSSYTAQIGSMKINEELDALNTMGLSPTELLVVPKVLGLLLIFPLLIFWSDFFSILGAMIMSKFMLHVSYEDFTTRLHDSVGINQFMLGLYKAPTFAVLIALVGCFQGFQVASNADSLGQKTTKSVVQALFLIIIADALYSVIYSWLDV